MALLRQRQNILLHTFVGTRPNGLDAILTQRCDILTMAEYWKSTPRYWCKYCSTYVRDTKLERQNHDATAKHQSAIKRSLRDLHRGKEKEEHEKERAKREVNRLNGIVSSAAGPSSSSSPRDAGGGGGALGETERKRQVQQLASLGVRIPDQFRGDLAMAGEWTVTSTTIVPDKKNKDGNITPDAIARGVHKRERTDEELEEEEAVKDLFKKPRRWGRDSNTTGTARGALAEEEDLDALLSAGLVVVKKTRDEGDQDEQGRHDAAVKEKGQDHLLPAAASFKKEPSDNDDDDDDDAPPIPDRLPARADHDDKSAGPPPPSIKTEHDGADGGASAPTVVFKKRKAKNIRQK